MDALKGLSRGSLSGSLSGRLSGLLRAVAQALYRVSLGPPVSRALAQGSLSRLSRFRAVSRVLS